jgi:hypothetical protein
MKFRVRDDEEKGEFAVQNVRIEARTRGFVAKLIVIVGLTLLLAAAVYAAVSGKDDELRYAMGSITALMLLVLRYYFKSREG